MSDQIEPGKAGEGRAEKGPRGGEEDIAGSDDHRRGTHLQDSHARHTRLRWSWTGLRPMSGGRGLGSSIRFFLGGCGIVMGGLAAEDEGGLSVESGGEFESVVMVWRKQGGVYMKLQA